MFHVFNTIIPIFVIILLGWLVRAKGLLIRDLISPLNRLVYYLAIPAMIFRAVASSSFRAHFDAYLLIGTLVPVAFLFAVLLGVSRILRIDRGHCGTFLQGSFHGNLGYIGLAVAYYYLGSEGFTRAGILAGFLMLVQNFFSILGLQIYSREEGAGRGHWFFIKKIMGNPVVISAIGGILFSLLEISLPDILDRSLSIISGMALPLALLIIGASLSLRVIQSHLKLTLFVSILKLLALPAVGLFIYRLFEIPPEHFLPGLILLASPSATIVYIMAKELEGSPGLASAAVSLTTLLSSGTFIFWLGTFS
ncbi:MAG: AEC family transporter [Pseudomonadota bacterium]